MKLPTDRKKILSILTHPASLAFLLSIIIHMAFIPVIVTVLMTNFGEKDYYTHIFIEPINREVESSQFKQEEEKQPDYNPPEKFPKGQIVDSPIPPEQISENIVEEKDVKFISDKTVRVKKETKSTSVLTGKYDVGSVTAGPDEFEGEETTSGAWTPQLNEGAKIKESERGEIQSGEDTVTIKETNPAAKIQLMPSFKAIASAVKGSGIDKLDGVEEGEKTLLNTNEWRYAGFFLRVKNAVAQYWNPVGAFIMYDPTGNVYGYKDRETIVKVVLDCKGEIKHLYVIQPSGAKFLDDEALSALRSAGPFPNPPKRLCDPENNIIVFNFGFFVKVGDKPVVKLKYNY